MKQTKFGISQITNETPKWANIALGLIILLTTITAFIVASDPHIPDALKVRIGVYLKGFDMFILGASKLCGLEVKQPTWNKNK